MRKDSKSRAAQCSPAGGYQVPSLPDADPVVLIRASGQPVQINPDGPLGDAAWTGQQLSRATQALPNGYCQLPVVKTCPHANSCLTCPMFATTAQFLPQHHAQRQATWQIISAAEAAGHVRVAEMNRQVAGNLDKIITALENEEPDDKGAAAGAH